MIKSGTCGAEAKRIAQEVLEPYGLALQDIIPRSRKLSAPRHHVMHALMATGRYSSPAVGRLLSRDHSTVLAGVRSHEWRITNPAYRKRPRRAHAPLASRAYSGREREEDAHQAYVARLQWQHGPERTKAILEGRDPATQADIAAWNNLGRAHERRAGL